MLKSRIIPSLTRSGFLFRPVKLSLLVYFRLPCQFIFRKEGELLFSAIGYQLSHVA